MPPPKPRKRTHSTHISENDNDPQQTTPTSTIAPRKRRRNNRSASRTNYSLRNRSIASDSQSSSNYISTNETATSSQRYNLRPRRIQSQVQLSEISMTHSSSTASYRENSSRTMTTARSENLIPPVVQPRQYRFAYISEDDDDLHYPSTTAMQQSTTIASAPFNPLTSEEDSEAFRSQVPRRRSARATSGSTVHNTRSRAYTDPTYSSATSSSQSATTTTADSPEFLNTGVAHVRLDRAIEIVIDSLQSLEGAVNNFDQLVLGLIYGRFSPRSEFDSIESMIRLSRILNLNFPSRLTQDEIDALPKIKFLNKSDSTASKLLAEKCPICLTEFNDQEIINRLYCTHLFHSECISTWLNANDSCPTCRRKVNGS